jgi:hypothetical protein
VSTDRATEQLELSEGRWLIAIRDHAQPPPDAGFPRRLRALADAAAQEQAAYAYAAQQGFGWRPGPPWLPPHELRSAPWRSSLAPTETWERFDDAVKTLSSARTGVSVTAIAHAFGQLAAAAWELADAVDRAARPRRAADAEWQASGWTTPRNPPLPERVELGGADCSSAELVGHPRVRRGRSHRELGRGGVSCAPP